MSAEASEAAEAPFSRRTLFWGIFASLLAAAGFFLLSTYAPDFRRPEGGATPLSKGGTGYAGLVEWLKLANGQAPPMARGEKDLESPLASTFLLIVTIAPESDPAALERIIKLRSGKETLFVLPKWQTMPLLGHDGWETKVERLPSTVVNDRLGRIAKAKLGEGKPTVDRIDVEGRKIAVPDELHWVADEHPLIAAGDGRAVLTELDNEPFYILTDPDLINNAALKDEQKAAAALDMIAMLEPAKGAVMFDLTLHGIGQNYDLAKLLVEPPFLALTLSVLVAAALAFLHGLGRFGPPRAEGRAIAFGKRALVDTTAMLLRRAGRLGGLGDRYAALMRQRAAALLGAPHGLQGEALDRWLDSRDKGEAHGFTSRFKAANDSNSLAGMHEAAEELHDWTARRLGERR
ncbi:DUF4350 domain-containing protein [Mesorhizobium sp. M1C.F.Ca.ET.193.01.1.1]|uniref:DUF4350 domain-containing protein n=1 Tax=unclassified Mesorhizobium TaxID=325217 RepID=UPI000FD2C646|nr:MULTISPECIES: DUF4350 domain-containing protein [unclassified Mesorhizobium]TGT00260.1 DUF4350 domain-containing protein [bacterium M00.F.Ca.ET.177.01.1.1]TGQ53666.1 DUF4350 domain-containing protein [Mesorhizobium sp. M1C.F.Ca.ET.210.01.1.1]TGQ71699.1 DUF4350 domain-containing protein [Mesorhizobium sp. M1C.F.Ca.ET.212.01.1.1]TGR08441.1 DUF4350 domain-containing protein [Mesorhizobium sp. M1C.F.Ca.ET.204.01.1.1]TGR28680.1 DUF4350 domain-containing protein [Mesorhizobium sp. M1C.F.Ca.ET.196